MTSALRWLLLFLVTTAFAVACIVAVRNGSTSMERSQPPPGISLVIKASHDDEGATSILLNLSNHTQFSVRFDKRGFGPPYRLVNLQGDLLPQIPSAIPRPFDPATDVLTLNPGEHWTGRVAIGPHLVGESHQESAVLLQLGYYPLDDYPADLREELFGVELRSNVIELTSWWTVKSEELRR